MAEAVKKIRGDVTEIIKQQLLAEIKTFVKDNFLNPEGLIGTVEHVSFSIPIIGQFCAIGWAILMFIPSVLLFPLFVWSLLGLLPIPGVSSYIRINFLWLQFDLIETWTMNCYYNALAALSAPAGIWTKWGLVKADCWYRAGHGTTKNGGIP